MFFHGKLPKEAVENFQGILTKLHFSLKPHPRGRFRTDDLPGAWPAPTDTQVPLAPCWPSPCTPSAHRPHWKALIPFWPVLFPKPAAPPHTEPSPGLLLTPAARPQYDQPSGATTWPARKSHWDSTALGDSNPSSAPTSSGHGAKQSISPRLNFLLCELALGGLLVTWAKDPAQVFKQRRLPICTTLPLKHSTSK